jgi:diadenosine tetraphosphate (Ap4A) HIT family hydrolase
VVLYDTQYLQGYSLLLPDPVVPDLNALAVPQRAQFLCDMALVGDALLGVTGAYRINYAILGNTVPALHAHIVPRYLAEPDDYRKGPPWFYPQEHQDSMLFRPERDQELIQHIAEAILTRL